MLSTPDAPRGWEPIDVVELELTAELVPIRPSPPAQGARCARALVRLRGTPLGLVELPLGPGGAGVDGWSEQIWTRLRHEISAHLASGGRPAPAALTACGLALTPASVSIVIATRDRPGALDRCLRSLAALDPPAREVIVVDNAPATSVTRDLVADEHPHVRYLREDRPGLAAAHNRGLAHAAGEIVAFTDDDVTVDSLWLRGLAAGFARDHRIACVTGLILPAELRTPAQVQADRHWALQKGFRPRLFTGPLRRLSTSPYPYTAGSFGSGANMAFRAGVLRELGGFDPLMGAGTPARGGDDLAAFFEVIAAGHWILYTPAALVWHWYAEDRASLRRQAYGYGAGLSAFAAKVLADDPLRVVDVTARSAAALAHARALRSERTRGDDGSTELLRLERRGMAAGAAGYVRSRWNAARGPQR